MIEQLRSIDREALERKVILFEHQLNEVLSHGTREVKIKRAA